MSVALSVERATRPSRWLRVNREEYRRRLEGVPFHHASRISAEAHLPEASYESPKSGTAAGATPGEVLA